MNSKITYRSSSSQAQQFSRSLPHIIIDKINARIVEADERLRDMVNGKQSEAKQISLDSLCTPTEDDGDWETILEQLSSENSASYSVKVYGEHQDRFGMLHLHDVLDTGYVFGYVEMRSPDIEIFQAPITKELLSQIDEHILITDNKPPHEGGPNIIYINDAFKQQTGYTLEDFQEHSFELFIGPETDMAEIEKMKDAYENEESGSMRVASYTKYDEMIWIDTKVSPIYDSRGEVRWWIHVGRDISELKEREHELADSLSEKKVLLQEIHHRVKNNLAIISGLLELQKFELGQSDAIQALEDSQLRIQSMSKVHEALYNSSSLSKVNLDQYLRNLIETISTSFGAGENKEITLEYDINSDINLSVKKAVPLALLVSELITNAYKHAFEEDDSGRITISARKAQGEVKVAVADNGKGMKIEEFEESQSLGSSIIMKFVDQLNATLNITSEEGTMFEVVLSHKLGE